MGWVLQVRVRCRVQQPLLYIRLIEHTTDVCHEQYLHSQVFCDGHPLKYVPCVRLEPIQYGFCSDSRMDIDELGILSGGLYHDGTAHHTPFNPPSDLLRFCPLTAPMGLLPAPLLQPSSH